MIYTLPVHQLAMQLVVVLPKDIVTELLEKQPIVDQAGQDFGLKEVVPLVQYFLSNPFRKIPLNSFNFLVKR